MTTLLDQNLVDDMTDAADHASALRDQLADVAKTRATLVARIDKSARIVRDALDLHADAPWLLRPLTRRLARATSGKRLIAERALAEHDEGTRDLAAAYLDAQGSFMAAVARADRQILARAVGPDLAQKVWQEAAVALGIDRCADDCIDGECCDLPCCDDTGVTPLDVCRAFDVDPAEIGLTWSGGYPRRSMTWRTWDGTRTTEFTLDLPTSADAPSARDND